MLVRVSRQQRLQRSIEQGRERMRRSRDAKYRRRRAAGVATAVVEYDHEVWSRRNGSLSPKHSTGVRSRERLIYFARSFLPGRKPIASASRAVTLLISIKWKS
jgi:hypothetical protein